MWTHAGLIKGNNEMAVLYTMTEVQQKAKYEYTFGKRRLWNDAALLLMVAELRANAPPEANRWEHKELFSVVAIIENTS